MRKIWARTGGTGARTAPGPVRLAVAMMLALVACGGPSPSGNVSRRSSAPATESATPSTWAYSNAVGPVPAGSIEQAMQHDLYSTTAIQVVAGEVHIHLVNIEATQTTTPIHHNMVIGDDLGHRFAESDVVEPGSDLVFTFAVPPGRYRFYCSINGHANAGMKGTISAT